MDHLLGKINTVNLVSKEEQVSRSLNSSYQAFLVRVINMIQLCNNNTKILRVLGSPTISSKEMEMLEEYKTRSPILQQMEVLFNQKEPKIQDLVKIKTAKTNTISILKARSQLRAMAITAE